MIEDELIKIWQTSPKREQIKFEKSKLMLEVQTSITKFERKHRFSVIAMVIIAAHLMIIFGYKAYFFTNSFAKLGVGVIFLWLPFLIFTVIKLQKTRPKNTESYQQYLEQYRQYLLNGLGISKRFMRLTVLPCYLAVALIMIGQLDLFNKSIIEIILMPKIWIQCAVFLIIAIVAYYANKREIRREYTPRLQKVNELLRLFKEED